ncbi:MAG: hypothetical protein WCG02_00665 [Candidatus Taylorbacteria bacterium]
MSNIYQNITKRFSAVTKGGAAVVVVVILLSSILTIVHHAYGQVMSSPRYQIQSDSLNFGGVRSTSASYAVEDTLGELATGVSSSTNYAMLAGYQQMQSVMVVVVPPTAVIMAPAIGGVSGGTSNGSTTFSVMTDDQAGYSVTIVASSSPALVSGADSFADYTPSGANADFNFYNAPTSSTFAFSPKGADIPLRFKDDGTTSCGTGSSQTTDACWDGLATTTKTIVSRTTANHPAGTVTTLKFRAASGSAHLQLQGTYVATTTITITPS